MKKILLSAVILALLLSLTLISGCMNGNAAASNRGASANFNLGNF